MDKITLKSARINVNLSRKEVASEVGVSESTIKSWELGKTFPQQPQIDKLCKLYKRSYDTLNFLPQKLT